MVYAQSAPNCLDVEFVRSLTDLFVGVERYAYPSVLYVWDCVEDNLWR